MKEGTKKVVELLDVSKQVVESRSTTHGDAFENMQDIANRWSNYLNNRPVGEDLYRLTIADVAYMMVEMKLSRAINGDLNEVDHLQDILGYAAIGASALKYVKDNNLK